MNSIPFLSDLFIAVLQGSQAIAGRFFITYRHGREISNDTLGQVLQEFNTSLPLVKYPLAMMAPPVLIGPLKKDDGWAQVRISIVFLRTSYYNADNTIAAINENTQTSGRPIVEDWADMAQEAVMFIRVLNAVMRTNNNMSKFRTASAEDVVITPMTSAGMDNASGVKLDFICSIFIGCDIEGYGDDAVSFANTIIL